MFYKILILAVIAVAELVYLWYKKNKEPELMLTVCEWSAKVDPRKGFGLVYIHLEGETDADMMSIKTVGTGEIYHAPIEVDEAGYFKQDVCYQIAINPDFEHTHRYGTEITAWRDMDKKVKKIKSGLLQFTY